MQKEIPLLFSTPMVQAILAGRKTQTRRIVKPQPVPTSELGDEEYQGPTQYFVEAGKLRTPARWGSLEVPSPYGKPGDLLYVRETFSPKYVRGCLEIWQMMKPTEWPCIYKADEPERKSGVAGHAWKPGIHLPKELSRIWLEVTDVRVERLQEISEADAVAEGIMRHIPVPGDGRTRYKNYDPQQGERPDFGVAVTSFASLWQSINGPESWDANPWVWVVSFKVVSTTGRPK